MDIYDDNTRAVGTAEPADQLRVLGSVDGKFAEERFIGAIAAATWKNFIKYVEIELNSHVVDCAFLQYLPNVESVLIKGRHVRSTRGIAKCRALASVVIRSSKKNVIALDDLPESNVTSLHIEKSRGTDLHVIRQAHQLRKLTLDGGDIEELDQLAGMQLHALNIVGTKLQTAELSKLASLDTVSFARCSELRGIGPGSFKAGSMTIQSCKEFNLRTFAAATSIKSLTIVQKTAPFDLADLGGLKGLESASITNSSVSSLEGVEGGFESLRRLWVSPASDSSIRKLSAELPRCKISNGEICFFNGKQMDSVQKFYE